MALTQDQLPALKADIAANTATIDWQGAPTQINALPAGTDAADAIAKWYNETASPEYWVWRTNVPTVEIHEQVTWSNFTPSDTVTAVNAEQWTACSMACQGKQFNLQIMLQSPRGVFNASKSTLRGGLNDATTNLPSGASFANRSGGWANILPILRRTATRLEQLFGVAGSGVGNNGGDPRGATTNPDVMTAEGTVSYLQVEEARQLP